MINLSLPNQGANIATLATSSSIPLTTSSYFSFHPNNNNCSNQLRSFLEKQNQQARISNTNISSNFHVIAQYILQSYFKVDLNALQSLRIVDLIVDQTYPDSITLRKLNENTSIRPYEYFNTISRDEDISRCPIFALAIYFVIRWSHPNPPISIKNFDNIPLLDPSFISINNAGANANNTANLLMNNQRVSRSQLFNPPQELTNMVFPWLLPLKQDMLFVDRTNYKLNSFVELFEFFASTIIQDLRYLHNHPDLLPNIVTFVAKFVPDLFNNEEFLMRAGGENAYRNNDNDSNDVLNDNDSRFLELSRRFTTENIRLSQQITNLKSELSSVQSMCDQILQLQRQLLSGSFQASSGNDVSSNPVDKNGIIILDKNSLNLSVLSSLVRTVEESEKQKQLQQQQPQIQLQQLQQLLRQQQLSQQPQQQQQPQQFQQADTPITAPTTMFPSLSNPVPSMFPSQGSQQLTGVQSQDSALRRKLPLPSAPAAGRGPFSPSPGPAPIASTNPDSPFPKRFRFEDKATPSQTALDSLLSKSIGSPKYSNLNQSPAPTNGVSTNLPSRFISQSSFPAPASPSGVAQTVTTNSNPSVVSQAGVDENIGAPVSSKLLNEGSENPEGDSVSETSQATAAATESPTSITGIIDSVNRTGNKDDQGSTSNDEKSSSPRSEKETSSKKVLPSGEKVGPNKHIKYKLSRDNKTVWDLYTEWYVGLNGKPSIKNLIDDYGWRRWKVSEDSHFFPTRRIIMDYIENECDRGIKLGRFTNPEQSRDEIRKVLVADLEKFRINSGLTLNSISVYFKNLTKENKEICIFSDFDNWTVRAMTEEEKAKYCKRQHIKESG